MAEVKRYGSDVIVDLLQRYGIEYVSINPGASFRGLHDSLINYGQNNPVMIECLHENIAIGLAHGYAKASGKPMAAIVHDVVGLLHSCMAIYYAYLDRAPVLILGATGPVDVARRRPRIDWTHTANIQGNAVRDYVKYDDQPFSIDSVPDSFARAYRTMLTEPMGPVYLCYDAGMQEDVLDREVPLPDPSRVGPPAPLQGERSALETIAQALVAAERPVIISETTGRHPGSFDRLVALAETVGAPVIDLVGRLNFPTNHPLNLTGADQEVLRDADLVLLLDVRDPFWPISETDKQTHETVYLIPPACKIYEVGLEALLVSKWSVEFGKVQETDLSVLANTAVALPVLIEAAKQAMAGQPDRQRRVAERREEAGERHRALRRKWDEQAKKHWDSTPLATARLAHEVWEVVKHHDWVLSAGDLNGWARQIWDFDKPYRHPGRSLGTATQISISLGVALAHRGSGKLVVDLQPDGDLLFDPGALWVATHHKIPFLAVMYNNRAYYNDWDHQLRVARDRGTPEANAHIGLALDGPAPDFAMLAKSFDWYAEGPIERPEDVRPAVERAIKAVKDGKPALLDTITLHR